MRRILNSILLLSLTSLSAASACGQSGVPSPPVELPSDVRELADKLIKMHLAWGPQIDTPNPSLVLKETSRSGGTVSYSLHATGVPAGQIFTVVSWPITVPGPVELMHGVTFDSTGLAICAGTEETCKGEKPNDDIELETRPVPGEPTRLGVISDDRSIRIFAPVVVALPIRGEDRGCVVEATMLLRGAAILLIQGSGFPPDREVTMLSNSEGEIHSMMPRVNTDGRFKLAILPAKLGLDHGNIKIELKAAKCSPSLKAAWSSNAR